MVYSLQIMNVYECNGKIIVSIEICDECGLHSWGSTV